MRLLARLLDTRSIPENGIDVVLFVYRILISFSLTMTHGWPKLLNFQDTVTNIPDPFGIGSFTSGIIAITSDFVCGVFVAFGLFSRISVLFILGVTLTGLVVVHAADPWVEKDVPYMYSVSFLLLFFTGPGKYSLDKIIYKKL